MEACERMRETFVGESSNFLATCLVKELFHLLLAHSQAAEPELDTFHRQRKQHEEHWEEDHSETLHTGK